MKYKWILLIAGLILLLGACGPSDKEDLTYKYEHPETEQVFNIVHVNTLYDEYIEKGKDDENGRLELYKETIIEPVYEACFKDAEFIHIVEPILGTAPKNFLELEKMTTEMEERKDELNEIIQESLLKSVELLPSEGDVTVCLFPSSDLSIPMYTAGAGKIIIPYNRHVTDDFLKTAIAHEYHHSVWAEKHIKNMTTVLDNMVFEGKAVMFEKLVYPEIDSMHIDEEYNKTYWDLVRPDLDRVDFTRSFEVILGGEDLPRNYGYSEGYKMVKAYLDENPDLTPAQWTAASTEEIIEKGEYFKNYE